VETSVVVILDNEFVMMATSIRIGGFEGNRARGKKDVVHVLLESMLEACVELGVDSGTFKDLGGSGH